MFLTKRFELDVENQGNPAVVGLDAVMRIATRRAPRLAAFIATAVVAGRKLRARIARAPSGDRVHREAIEKGLLDGRCLLASKKDVR